MGRDSDSGKTGGGDLPSSEVTDTGRRSGSRNGSSRVTGVVTTVYPW